MLKIDATAPNFILPDAHGDDTVLEDFGRTWMLLLFFPGRFGRRWARPLCDLQENIGEFGKRGVQLLGIGFLPPGDLEPWARRHGIGFPLLWDRQKRIARRYKALNLLGLDCRRAYYLIGPDRLVVHARIESLPFRYPSSRELLDVVDVCQAAPPKKAKKKRMPE